MLILIDPDGSRRSQIDSDRKRHERPTANVGESACESTIIESFGGLPRTKPERP